MDTRQMRLFVALAETLHFGHAAARMNMTQPPFSRQIARLEQDLGVTLVTRSSRQVALTAAGRRFLEDSRAVLARFEEACRDARRVAAGQTGELALGFMMHAAHRLAPELVSRYGRLRPDVRLRLVEATPGEIEGRLVQGELDAAITFAGPATPGLESHPLMTDRLCLVAPAGHPLAARPQVVPEDLAGLALIAAPAATAPALRAAIAGYAARSGAAPVFAFEPQLQATILRLAAAGLGVALVPRSICDALGPDLAAQPLADAPELEVVVKTRRGADNPALPPLLGLVAEMYRAGPG